MRRWLVPVREDRPVEDILRQVKRSASPGDLHVVILSVQPKPIEWQTRGLYREAIRDRLIERGWRSCQPLAHCLSDLNVSHDVRVVLGDEATEIVRCAESENCDEIILQADRPGWLKHSLLGAMDWLAGSTTTQVARSSLVPVVVMH